MTMFGAKQPWHDEAAKADVDGYKYPDQVGWGLWMHKHISGTEFDGPYHRMTDVQRTALFVIMLEAFTEAQDGATGATKKYYGACEIGELGHRWWSIREEEWKGFSIDLLNPNKHAFDAVLNEDDSIRLITFDVAVSESHELVLRQANIPAPIFDMFREVPS